MNAEALVLLMRFPGYAEYEKAASMDNLGVGINEASMRYDSTIPRIVELERSIVMMRGRAEKMKKELARVKAEVSSCRTNRFPTHRQLTTDRERVKEPTHCLKIR